MTIEKKLAEKLEASKEPHSIVWNLVMESLREYDANFPADNVFAGQVARPIAAALKALHQQLDESKTALIELQAKHTALVERVKALNERVEKDDADCLFCRFDEHGEPHQSDLMRAYHIPLDE